jgi:hypothetical protein
MNYGSAFPHEGRRVLLDKFIQADKCSQVIRMYATKNRFAVIQDVFST